MMVSNDYTEQFNKARIEAGLSPTKATILWIHEGMKLPCGCKVHNASLSHFSVYHNDNCKSITRPWLGKEIIGVPGSGKQACFTADWDKMIVAVTNPSLGLFPYEEAK